MDELSEEERAIVGLVREFVNRDVRPVASELEHHPRASWTPTAPSVIPSGPAY